MTQTIGAITWVDQSDPHSPIAPYTLDFSQDTLWQFPSLQSTYLNDSITPAGVLVDNSQNSVAVVVVIGAQTLTLQANQSQNVPLPPSTQSVAFFCSNPVQVNIQFWVKQPISNSVNYEALQTVPNVFPGGVTTGAANAQALSVGTGYSFTTGILVIGTAGFTNTGPMTISINGMGNLAVLLEGQPLRGGEITAGSNFILSANAQSGSFDLVSMPFRQGARAFVTFNSAGAILSSYNVAAVAHSGAGSWQVLMIQPAPSADYCVVASCDGGGGGIFGAGQSFSTTIFKVYSFNTVTQSGQDATIYNAVVYW
jgi:hypothetical protein